MNPVWDDDVKRIINQIRGRVAQGTVWEIEEGLFKKLRQKIVARLYGVIP
jgi:hypothetical protein